MVSMVADIVPAGYFRPYQVGIQLGLLPDDEKSRFGIVLLQDRQQLGSVGGMRAVIKGDGYLPLGRVAFHELPQSYSSGQLTLMLRTQLGNAFVDLLPGCLPSPQGRS